MLAAKVLQGQHRTQSQGRMDTQRAGSGAARLLESAGVGIEQVHESPGRLDRARGGLLDALKKEIHPGLPVARGPHPIKEVVVERTVRFQIKRQVEKGLGKQAALMQQQCDEQAPEPAIPVEKRMDGLELDVGQGRAQENGDAKGVIMEKPLQRRHARLHLLRRRGDESRIAGPCAADPVLAAAKLTWLFVTAPAPGHERRVHFPQEAVREWKSLAQSSHTVLERSDVVGNLHHVVQRDAGRFLKFEEQEVRERRLRAFDLGGKHRLPAHIGIEEQVRIRQQRADAVEPAHRQRGPFQQELPCPRNLQRRQRERDKRPHRLPARSGDVMNSSGFPVHGAKLE